MPDTPSSTWSWMPPTAEATTGAFFHIASATVSPKASTSERCVTTALIRWIALMMVALTSRSVVGTASTWMRRAAACGSVPARETISPRTLAAAASRDGSGLGPTSTRWASAGRASICEAKASTSSRPPLSRSQRWTWVTIRAPWGTGAPKPASAPSSFSPRKASGRPSSRMKGTASKGAWPSKKPLRRATDQDSSRSSTRFLGESGLMEGVRMEQRASSM